MGVHTGDSITVAPAQTLTDVEYQALRDAAFAVHPRASASRPAARTCSSRSNRATGEMVVIEMNPRVSRSSALASKATGFPIAKIAHEARRRLHARRDPERHHAEDAGQLRADARLRRHEDAALGVREVPRRRRACSDADAVGRRGDGDRPHVPRGVAEGAALAASTDAPPRLRPGRRRRAVLATAATPIAGAAVRARRRRREALGGARSRRRIDPGSSTRSRDGRGRGASSPRPASARSTPARWRRAKRLGFGDAQLAQLLGVDRGRRARRARRAPACGRSSRRSTRAPPSSRPRRRTTTRPTRTRTSRATATGRRCSSSAPARTASARASSSTTAACTPRSPLRDAGFETIMVNCNPETVSTDYDTSDRLYFEPLTLEDVLDDRRGASSRTGVIVQFGGQTPLRLAKRADDAGVPILGTPSDADRPGRGPRAVRRAARLELGIRRRPGRHRERRRRGAPRSPAQIGYPVLVRPSYVLGGRAMEIVYDERADRCGVGAPDGASSTRLVDRSSRTRSRSTSTRSPTATTC